MVYSDLQARGVITKSARMAHVLTLLTRENLQVSHPETRLGARGQPKQTLNVLLTLCGACAACMRACVHLHVAISACTLRVSMCACVSLCGWVCVCVCVGGVRLHTWMCVCMCLSCLCMCLCVYPNQVVSVCPASLSEQETAWGCSPDCFAMYHHVNSR
jgi:hypothetical protein